MSIPRKPVSNSIDNNTSHDFLAGGGEMGALVRSKDWSATPLGPVESWPQSLRSAASIMLNSCYPIALYWGAELALIYNDAWSPIPGDKHPWALGRPAREVWPEIWDAIGPLYEQVFATGEGTWSEDQLLPMQRYGYTEECYFNFTFSPIRGESGGIDGIFNAVVETTDRVIGERRLRTLSDLGARVQEARHADEACRRASYILEQNNIDVPFALIYLLNEAGTEARLAAFSGLSPGHPAAPQSVGLGTEDVSSAWPLSAVAASREAHVLRNAAEHFGALPGGYWPEPAVDGIVLPLVTPGQERLSGFLVAGVNPRRHLDSQYRSFFKLMAGHVATAIANARAYEAERKRAEALAEIDRAKTLFFSNVSHEFRTPLTLMLGPLEEILQRPALPEGDRRELSAVHRNSLRLLRLVNTLLDFSRVEAGRMKTHYQKTDLADFTAELASNFSSACERAGLQLFIDCPPLPEHVYVDREMWEKIVFNLLSNAFKFTFEGKIEISLRAVDGQVLLQVSDTGTGIPDEELPHIFDRFHRAEQTRGRTHEGTGIGLAFVKELIHLHGGTVGVNSAFGKGTTFTVSVPRETAHLPANHPSSMAQVSTAVGAEAYVAEALRWLPGLPEDKTQKTGVDTGVEEIVIDGAELPLVLVADDNADMRAYLARVLRAHWRVETAVDGVQALGQARLLHPDLILSDVMMPNMNGFELLGALRQDSALSMIPVIMISARVEEEARIEAIEAGADDYLFKPFSTKELIARVNSQLKLARNARERAELQKREQEARQEAELQKRHFTSLFMQAPAPVAILRGRDHIIELVNTRACKIWCRERVDVINKPLFEALPELKGQVFEGLLANVFETGEPYVGSEVLARFDPKGDGKFEDFYLNFVYAPMRTVNGDVEGILVLGFDVTEQVIAR